MHIPYINVFNAVAAAGKEIEKAKADDGKIDAKEALQIIGAMGVALLTGVTPNITAGETTDAGQG